MLVLLLSCWYVPVSTKTKLLPTSLCLFFDVNGCPGLIAKLLL